MPARRQPPRQQPPVDRQKTTRELEIELPIEVEQRIFRRLEKEGRSNQDGLNSFITRAVEQYLGKGGAQHSEVMAGDSLRELLAKDLSSRIGSDISGSLKSSEPILASSGELRGSSAFPKTPVGGEARPSMQVVRFLQTGAVPESSTPDQADGGREDILSLEEIDHTGTRDVFERTIEGFDRLRRRLEEINRSPSFDQDSFRTTRDAVLELGRISTLEPPPDKTSRGDSLHAPNDKPLFGLHNRDYPSLWGLQLLVEVTREEPAPWSEFASGLQLAADAYGGCLHLMDRIEKKQGIREQSGLKYAPSFPNPNKEAKGGQWIPRGEDRKAARLYPFVKNTFGRIQKGRSGRGREARGPLPRWDAIRFIPEGNEILVEPTATGYGLLTAMDGITLDLPHGTESAGAFMRYLMANSPGDAGGFRHVLEAVRNEGDRDGVVEANIDYFNGFLETDERRGEKESWALASTMTQGYIARAREWGLLEPGMIRQGDSKIYLLTDLGQRSIELLGS